MGAGGDITRIELGGGPRRRWWPFVAGGIAAWVVLAAVVGSSGGDDDDAGGLTTSTTTERTTTTERRPRSPTSTTSPVLEGAPFLGRETGWQLIVPNAGPGPGRLIDLDTGTVSEFEDSAVLDTKPGGALVQDENGRTAWAPFPFADATRVALHGVGIHGAFLVEGEELAWLIDSDASDETRTASLVSLVDGSAVGSVELPASSWVVDVLGDDLVVFTAGDTFLVGLDDRRELVDGETLGAVFGGRVLVHRCDGELRCRTVAVRADGHEVRLVIPVPLYGSHRAGERSLLVLTTPGDRAYIVDSNGEVVEVGGLHTYPQGAWGSAWTPGDEFLLVPYVGEIRVIEPFADGGPVELPEIPVDVDDGVQLAVVGPGP